MKQRVTYKTQDGQLKEQVFDDFNEFADMIEGIAGEYYSGINPEVSVESIYGNQVKKEKVSTNEPRPEFLD
jgi:hypothetical protein